MSTSPWNDSHHQKLCHLSCTQITSTPSKLPPLAAFGAWRTSCAVIWNFFTGLYMSTSIHIFCFKNGWNWCRTSAQKAVLVSWQKKKTKHILAPLCGNLRVISRDFLCGCASWPLNYIPGFIQIHSVLGSNNQKTPTWPLKEKLCRLFKSITSNIS